ncbi:MAG: oxidoreductase family protein [Salibacteraceae bacterium]
MIEDHFLNFVQMQTQSTRIGKVSLIQELWSGYGQISRVQLFGGSYSTVVVKYIDLESANAHPRGWNTNLSHKRKVKSYEVEINWYKKYNETLPDSCKTAKCLGVLSLNNKHCIVLEDLDEIGFPIRKNQLSIDGVKVGLKWLAQFHGHYLMNEAEGLWEEGTYWHLNTRPDEWKAIKNKEIQNVANKIDEKLKLTKYPTIVHGDAKLANFCFSKDLNSLAAVDFQYVGKGCGMKDVAYFLGSCVSESDLLIYEDDLLNTYFSVLKETVKASHSLVDVNELELDWRKLYPYAWADFTRFLLGWMPTHQKLNAYSSRNMMEVLDLLKQENEI